MAFELFFYRNRTVIEVVTLEEDDGNGLTLNSNDKLRFKIYRRDQATPILDIDSIGALSGGSLVTVTRTASAAQANIKVCQDDLTGIAPGTYSAEISVVDSGDSNLIKVADVGVVHILGSGGGDIGNT